MNRTDPGMIEREVRYALEFHRQHWPSVPASAVEELIRDFCTLASNTPSISRGEVGVVSLHKPKTAALIADRVWLQFSGYENTPDFAFGWESPVAVRLSALFALIQLSNDPPESTSVDFDRGLTRQGAEFLTWTEKELADDYARLTGATAIPMFSSVVSRDSAYSTGDHSVVIAVISNAATVLEDSLTWDQVREFRGDSQARASYRRFVHWLDHEMVGRSAQFIIDELNARRESYDWALRKHGIQTALGTLERTLTISSLSAGTAAASLAALTSTPFWALLAGAGVLVGRAAVSVGTALLERREIQRATAEIAFVHQVEELQQG